MVAAGLRARGAGPGDRVAFRLPTGLDSVVAYRACWRIGAVAVALHPAAGLHQLARAMDQVRPTVAVADPTVPGLGSPRTTTIDELSREGAAALAGSTGTRTPAAHPPHSTHPAEAVGPPGDTAVHRAVNTDDADAVVMFTSGSTGTPRGVVHTHGSLGYKVSPAHRGPWPDRPRLRSGAVSAGPCRGIAARRADSGRGRHEDGSDAPLASGEGLGAHRTGVDHLHGGAAHHVHHPHGLRRVRARSHRDAADDLMRWSRGDSRVLQPGRSRAGRGGETLLRLDRGPNHRHVPLRRPAPADVLD